MASPRPVLTGLLAATFCVTLFPAMHAQDGVAPADLTQMLETIRGIRDKQITADQGLRTRATQEAAAAVQNPLRAADLYEDAYRVIHFEGAARESARFRDWKDGEGSAIREKEVLSALHIYFNWLSLTLQRANGATNEQLLGAVLAHAQAVMADQTAMDVFEEQVKREREAGVGMTQLNQMQRQRPNVREREKRVNDQAVKKLHDELIRTPLAGSAYVEAISLTRLIDDVAPAQKQGRGNRQNANNNGGEGKNWSSVPGDFDGIYTQILLPELRAKKDPRALDYWDAKLRREADVASRSKLAYAIEKFNTERRPALLWSRAKEWQEVGNKDRAVKDMFAIIKAYPTHAQTVDWVNELERLLKPESAAGASAPTAP